MNVIEDNELYLSENGVLYDLFGLEIFELNNDSLKVLRNNQMTEELNSHLLNRRINIETSLIKNIKINISQICNLRCTYCYASNGKYDKRGIMNLDTCKKVGSLIKELKTIESISFFGGEPTLNVKAIEYFCSNFSDKKFLMQTNGYNLSSKKILDLIQKYKIEVTVSLDEDKEHHDQCRRDSDNEATYDVIKRNIKHATSNNVAIECIQVTTSNFDKKFEIAKRINDELGVKTIVVKKVKEISLIKEGIMEEELVDDTVFLNETEYIKGNNGYNSNLEIVDILEPFFTGISNSNKYCAAAIDFISVDIDGNIYPCDLFIGQKNEIISSLGIEGIEHTLDKIYNASEKYLENVKSCKECLDCIAKYNCKKCHKIKSIKNYCENRKELTRKTLEWFSKNLDSTNIIMRNIEQEEGV